MYFRIMQVRVFILLSLSLIFSRAEAQNKKIDSLRSALGSSKADTNRVKTLISLAFQLRSASQFDSSITNADQAIALAEKLGYRAGIANALSEKGVSLSFKGEYKTALEQHFKSLDIRKTLNDSNAIAGSYNGIGTCYYDQGNLDEALKYYLLAMRIYEALKHEARVAIILNNTGRIYEDRKQFDKSLECHFRALAIRERLGDKYRITASLTNIGNVYFYMNDLDKSYEYHQRALDLRIEINDKRGQAMSLGNLGNILAEKKEYSGAIVHLEKALAMAEEIGSKDIEAVATNGLGSAYYKSGNYRKAAEFSRKSLEIAERSNAMKDMRLACITLTEIYSAMGDHKTALAYYKRSAALQDSILNEASAKQLNELETKYETEKKENEIKLLTKEKELDKAEIEKGKLVRNSLLGGSGLILLLGLVVYGRYREKRKANILLAEKNEAITKQKEEIEIKNDALTIAYKVIEEKNNDITDSIRYAKRIQEAILPVKEEVEKALPQSFVMYKPKDIVSGDFYWFYQRSGKIYIAACDCTGHGVPGAFMSMIGSDMLNHTMLDGTEDPGEILTALNKKIRLALKQHDSSSQTMDGMDIALCMIEKEKQLLTYSAANRPLYFIRDGGLTELTPDKAGIAGYTEHDFSFTSHRVPLQPGDAFYLFSDGFADQFGGDKGKKYTTRRFRELLLSIHELAPAEQERQLRATIEQWQGNMEQVDDMLVIGVKI